MGGWVVSFNGQTGKNAFAFYSMDMRIPKDQAIMYAGALMTVALVILVATRVGSVLLWNFGLAPQFIQG